MLLRVTPAWVRLKVKPDSNWTRPSGTTVLAGVKVGRSVLIGPSRSASCENGARSHSWRFVGFGAVFFFESSSSDSESLSLSFEESSDFDSGAGEFELVEGS